jgi:hypothetical protein
VTDQCGSAQCASAGRVGENLPGFPCGHGQGWPRRQAHPAFPARPPSSCALHVRHRWAGRPTEARAPANEPKVRGGTSPADRWRQRGWCAAGRPAWFAAGYGRARRLPSSRVAVAVPVVVLVQMESDGAPAELRVHACMRLNSHGSRPCRVLRSSSPGRVGRRAAAAA